MLCSLLATCTLDFGVLAGVVGFAKCAKMSCDRVAEGVMFSFSNTSRKAVSKVVLRTKLGDKLVFEGLCCWLFPLVGESADLLVKRFESVRFVDEVFSLKSSPAQLSESGFGAFSSASAKISVSVFVGLAVTPNARLLRVTMDDAGSSAAKHVSFCGDRRVVALESLPLPKYTGTYPLLSACPRRSVVPCCCSCKCGIRWLLLLLTEWDAVEKELGCRVAPSSSTRLTRLMSMSRRLASVENASHLEALKKCISELSSHFKNAVFYYALALCENLHNCALSPGTIPQNYIQIVTCSFVLSACTPVAV